MTESNILVNKLQSMNNFRPLQIQLIIELHKNGPLNRKDLTKILNKARTTVYDNLARLERLNIVSKFSINKGERGRPIVYWKLKN